MAEQARVFVVTPVHNGVKHTMAFLASLQSQTYQNVVVVIADDGSTDDTTARIQAEFPETIVLSGDGSLWWSGATNLGVKYALENGADYVFTVNNDVELDPAVLTVLTKTAQDHDNNVLVGSVIYDESERTKVWYAGGAFDRRQGELVHQRQVQEGVMEPAWLTGMGVLVPKAAFTRVGLYDARHFPQYFGDADFSLRAKRAGFRLLVASGSQIYADTQSAWINKDFTKKPFGFLYQILFSIRSQYYVPARVAFYRRYWPGNYAGALLKLYLWVLQERVIPFLKAKLKRFLQNIGAYPRG